MKKAYVGFVKKEDGNFTAVADYQVSRREFERELRFNGYKVVYIMNYSEVRRVNAMDCIERLDWIFKNQTTWKARGMVSDYLDQCMDIIKARVAEAEAFLAAEN